MSQLIVNVPGTAKGEPIEVAGLGVFPNGSKHDLTTEQMDQFKILNNREDVEWPLVVGEPLQGTPVEKKKNTPAVAEGTTPEGSGN